MSVTIPFITLLIYGAYAADFTIYKHGLDTTARCLDGTQSALYQYEGQQKSKVIIFFQGGGSCNGGQTEEEVLQTCLKRSKNNLGSSQKYSDSQNFDSISFLSSKQKVNPQFHDWTKFYFPYCDGSFHQGTVSDPVSYDGTTLYFRGKDNVEAHLSYLSDQFDVFNADEIIVMGTSAGAIAARNWANEIYSRSNNKEGVTILMDSGIFGDLQNGIVTTSDNPFLKLVNSETNMPIAECVVDYPTQIECFNAGIAAEYIIPPVFVLQSPYDKYAITNGLGLNCHQSGGIDSCNSKELQQINELYDQIQAKIESYTKFQKNGAWTINCLRHVFLGSQSLATDQSYISPYQTGLTINDAFENFLAGTGQRLYIDDMKYPDNPNPSCKKGSGSRLPLILGLSIGLVVLVIIIVVVCVYCYKKRQSSSTMQGQNSGDLPLDKTQQETQFNKSLQ